MIGTMTPTDAAIRDFALARIAEDTGRGLHRKFLRNHRLRLANDRYWAVYDAVRHIDDGDDASLGRDRLRRVARRWRRHPDYDHTWRP